MRCSWARKVLVQKQMDIKIDLINIFITTFVGMMCKHIQTDKSEKFIGQYNCTFAGNLREAGDRYGSKVLEYNRKYQPR